MAGVRGNAAAKWARRAGSAGQEYEEGVKNPRAPWASSTLAATEAHKAGTMQALNEGRFAKGVQKAGDAAWSEGALKKGPGRFVEGVQTSEQAYQAGVAPYQAKLAALNLPPRGPKGDPRNLERVKVVTQAMRQVKTGKAS